MEKFARQQFQQQSLRQQPTEYSRQYKQKGKSKEVQIDFQNTDLITQAYIKEFGKAKGDLLQDWLKMSHEELLAQCRSFNLTVSEKLNENIQTLFDHLNKFESDTLTANQETVPTPILDGVLKKFGMKKQEQMDKWLDMPNADLMTECQKYGLPVSEKHIHNIQTLFNYLKSFDSAATRQKLAKSIIQVEKNEYVESQSKQFHRKNFQNQSWDQQAQSEAALSEVEADLNKIFGRKAQTEQQKAIQKSKVAQVQEIAKGPLARLPMAPNFLDQTKSKAIENLSSYIDPKLQMSQVGKFDKTEQKLMGLSCVDFEKQITEVQWEHNLLEKIGDKSLEQMVKELDQMQRSPKDYETFLAMKTNTDRRMTLINLKTMNLIKLENNKNNKLTDMLQSRENILNFAHDNLQVLNKASREVVKNELEWILRCSDIEKLRNKFPTTKHINSFAQLLHQLNIGNSAEYKQFIDQSFQQRNNIIDIKTSQPILPQLVDLSGAIETLLRLTKYEDQDQFVQQVQEKLSSQTQAMKDFQNTEFTPEKLSNLSINQLANLTLVCKTKEQLQPLLKIISSSNQLSNLTNVQLIYLTERVIDLNNKSIISSFMQQLEQVYGIRFTMEETIQILAKLIRLQSGADLNLLDNFLDTKIKQMYLPQNSKDLSKTLDIIADTQKFRPQLFKRLKFGIRLLVASTYQLQKRQIIPLRDMVRLATFMNPNVSKPDFFLNEIVQSEESLIKDVPEQEVEQLVDQLIKRAQQQRFSFDHLKSSFSVIHSEFVPASGDTYQFMRKLLNHQISSRIINKIAADSFIVSRLFPENEEAQKFCEENFRKQLGEIKSLGPDIPVEDIANIFHMIANLREISLTPDIDQLSRQLFEESLAKIKTKFESTTNGITSIQELIKIDYAILQAAQSFQDSQELVDKYRDTCWFQDIIDECLRTKMQLPLVQKSKLTAQYQLPQQQIAEQAKSLSWAQFERQSQSLIKHFLVLIESSASQTDQMREVASKFLQKLQNSRSLHGENLANLYQLVKKLQPDLSQTRDFDHLLMNVASNLRTISVKLMYINPDQEENEENLFKKKNATILEQERSLKKMILDQYMQIYKYNPTIFQQTRYSLSPLSNLMAQLFDSFDHQDVLNCMNLLSDNNIDNYSEEFILKLYENYAQQAFMAQMYDQNPKFFFEFSKAWPRFLRNNAILNQLTRFKGQSVLVSDQSESLQILTRRNVLHPELMNLHLDTFIRMKDKEQVSKYLRQFLESAAFFGYTNGVNIEQLTQVFRRIYRTPAECDLDELLNFLVVLAISKSYYQDFDEKSKIFIDQALDFLESSTVSQQHGQKTANSDKYCGTQHLIAKRPKDVQSQFANKQQDQLESEQEFKLSFFQQIPTTTKTYNKQSILNVSQRQNEETERARAAHFQGDSDVLSGEEEDESQRVEILDKTISIDDDSPEAEITEEIRTQQQQTTRKSYERKGSESQYQEDFEYLKFRNRKLASMNRKDRHLLMYSNINQLNFVDINQKSIAKAWTILFHYRAKSLQSMLFEEFNSITQRNAVNKTKSHELFSKLYVKVMEQSYQNGFTIQMANSCDRTGWPIDISLRFKDTKLGNSQQHAVYFLLQEELCYNAQTQSEEPLGLQKLMVRHLQTISDYKVHFVTETEVQSNLDGVLSRLMEKMNE